MKITESQLRQLIREELEGRRVVGHTLHFPPSALGPGGPAPHCLECFAGRPADRAREEKSGVRVEPIFSGTPAADETCENCGNPLDADV